MTMSRVILDKLLRKWKACSVKACFGRHVLNMIKDLSAEKMWSYFD